MWIMVEWRIERSRRSRSYPQSFGRSAKAGNCQESLDCATWAKNSAFWSSTNMPFPVPTNTRCTSDEAVRHMTASGTRGKKAKGFLMSQPLDQPTSLSSHLICSGLTRYGSSAAAGVSPGVLPSFSPQPANANAATQVIVIVLVIGCTS